MTRLDEIRARASILLEEPSNLSHETAHNYLYLLSRVERLEAALKHIDNVIWSIETPPAYVIQHFKETARTALDETEGEERG